MKDATFQGYHLHGAELCQYSFVHAAGLKPHQVLSRIASYAKEHKIDGLIESVHTDIHSDDEELLITHVIFSIF